MYNPSYFASPPIAATAPERPLPRFHQLHADGGGVARTELLAGLTAARPYISPKFLYDHLGSTLFTAITQVDEYYPTRCETEILGRHASEMISHVGPVKTLIDLGAGDCVKAEALFDHACPVQYVPVDISSDYLRSAITRLNGRYPELELVAIGMDFFNGLDFPADVGREQRLFFYPGSSIGNLPPAEAAALLARIRQQSAGGGLLIGVDLIKDRTTLELAYNDPLGLTAAFNLNMLRHTNRIVGTDFDVSHWQHVAFFNESQSRIEMHLQAASDVTVSWPDASRTFQRGERIHTESSYKYRPAGFKAMLEKSGFHNVRYWTDPAERFAVFGARA